MKLISMTDFIESVQLPHSTDEAANESLIIERFYNNVRTYMYFLKQPLTLGMFVPTDDQGNVLKDPAYTTHSSLKMQNLKHEQYEKAKEKVLFKGFKYRRDNVLGCDYVESEEFQLNVTLKKGLYWLDSSDAFYDFVLHGDTIESLTNVVLNPELTETAIKQFM